MLDPLQHPEKIRIANDAVVDHRRALFGDDWIGGAPRRHGLIAGFTKRYGLKRLVWFEPHGDIRTAIQREKAMKHWPRAWKARLINTFNPDWDDLYETLF